MKIQPGLPLSGVLRGSSTEIAWLVRGVIVLDALIYSGIIPLLPQVGADAGLSDGVLGLILGATAFSALFTALPMGLISDRWNPRPVLIMGVAGLTIGTFSVALFPSPVGIGAGRLVQGIASSAIWTAGLVLVSTVSGPEHLGREVGWAFSAATVGEALGPVLGGYLFEQHGLTAFFWATGVLGIAATLGLAGRLKVVPRPVRAHHAGESRIKQLKLSHLLTGMLVTLLVVTTFGALLLLAPLKFARELGLTAFAIGLALIGWNASLFFSQIGAGHWSDRSGWRAPVVSGMLLLGVALAGLASGTHLGLTLLALYLAATSIGLAVTAASPLVTRSWEAIRPSGAGLGTAYGIVGTIWSLGFLLGNSAAGWLLAWWDTGQILRGLAVLVALPGIMILLNYRDRDGQN